MHTATLGSVLPYISLNNTDGVTALFVPRLDDGCSPEIGLPNKFPLGNQAHFEAYVCSYLIIITFTTVYYLEPCRFAQMDTFHLV